jgi:transposase
MRRYELEDRAWDRIEHLLPGRPGAPGTTGDDNRLFVNAVLWIARTGAPWRDLPERFGNCNSVSQRFNRWAQRGVWGRVMEVLGGDADLEWLLIDSTVVRAHQHAAGAEKN